MDSCGDTIHFILLPLAGQDLLSLLRTSKSVRLSINKHLATHPTFWHEKVVLLLKKSILYRPKFDWNRIYWNFASGSSLRELAESAATHLETLKICREVHGPSFCSHVPLHKVTDVSIIQYLYSAGLISTCDQILGFLTSSLNLEKYEVTRQILSITSRFRDFGQARTSLIRDRLATEDIIAVETLTANYPSPLGYRDMETAVYGDRHVALTYLVRTVPTVRAKEMEKLGRLTVTRSSPKCLDVLLSSDEYNKIVADAISNLILHKNNSETMLEVLSKHGLDPGSSKKS